VSIFIENQGFSKTLCILCLVVMVGSDASFAAVEAREGGLLSNFQIVERVSSELAGEIASGVASKAHNGFVFLNKTKGAGDADFILENALVVQMKESGMRVTAMRPQPGTADSDSVGYDLSYRIVRLGVTYPKIYRHHWFFSRRVERSAQATVYLQLIDRRSGDILWVGEAQRRYDDTIPYAALARVEEKQYEFTRPPRNEVKMGKFVEPIIVAGIITGLVYLFFTNQKNE
jgi:hypothetical protein